MDNRSTKFTLYMKLFTFNLRFQHSSQNPSPKWLLLGHGCCTKQLEAQGKLNVVSPEAEGYSGAQLATGYTGKSCYYIMPIQGSLDTSPLPFTAEEFSRMPKAKCKNCQIPVPVQLLSLHVKDCQQTVNVCDSDCEVANDQTELCPSVRCHTL
ncbi:uncharacterized protein LOC143509606 [Brachyhypopomus gauderio]|uniref:uncharacterized protein LOC143509606 n=1 Tax=Brachyhypopomus gauderio TaxID=698409 RepID=UPI00404382F2